LWILFMAIAALTRSLWPIDETRYATVAWDMWQNRQWLVPHLNGAPYAHKPPVLFWLMHLGWALFGVNDLWPRLIAPLAGLVTVLLGTRLARRMWPEIPAAALLLPWLLCFGLYWIGFHNMLMFDGLLALWTMLVWTGLWQATHRMKLGFALVGVGLGMGLLSKGPIILLFGLPPAVLAPLWHPSWPGWRVWGAGLGRALGIMALIALAWALPAALIGGKDYAADLLWRQSAGRALESFAHRRPWWWYLPILPLMVLPWSLFPASYRALGQVGGLVGRDRGVRFCLSAFVPGLVLCSLVSGKQPHYLLPLLPALMLLLARGMAGMPLRFSLRPLAAAVLVAALVLTVAPLWTWLRSGDNWVADLSPLWGAALLPTVWILWRVPSAGFLRQIPTVGMVMALLLAFGHLTVIRDAGVRFDLTEVSRRLGALERDQHPLAFVGMYRGQFQFMGRLQRTPTLLDSPKDVRLWAMHHPDGIVIDEVDQARDCATPPSILCQPHRGHYLVLREAAQLASFDGPPAPP
jgi:4-amino-4-deoxy-L-arabinose transferase-like glycosyltransferase